jgi:hypothetical protein
VAANVWPLELGLVALWVDAAAVAGSKAVLSDASCPWIWDTRLTTSV